MVRRQTELPGFSYSKIPVAPTPNTHVFGLNFKRVESINPYSYLSPANSFTASLC